MKRWVLIVVAVVAAGLVAFAGPGVRSGDGLDSLGFAVSVEPDKEFADFTSCGMSVFRLDNDEKAFGELPALRLAAGDSNSMQLGGEDFEVTFTCSVDNSQTEATYEIAGRVNERLVMTHLATVRLR